MSELVKLEIKNFPGGRLIGKAARCVVGTDEITMAQLWEECEKDDTFTQLENMKELVLEDARVNWLGCFDETAEDFVCFSGVLMQPGTQVPEGLAFFDLAPTHMAIAHVRGPIKGNMIHADGGEVAIFALAKEGLQIDQKKGYMMELYNKERFLQPKQEGAEMVILEYCFPLIDA